MGMMDLVVENSQKNNGEKNLSSPSVNACSGYRYPVAIYSIKSIISYSVTVGATDRSDQRSSFSNYGKCVDIFAPVRKC